MTHQQQTAFENIVDKGESNSSNFSIPTMFSTKSDICIPICPFFDIMPLFAAELGEPKIGISGSGLTLYQKKKQNVGHFDRVAF